MDLFDIAIARKLSSGGGGGGSSDFSTAEVTIDVGGHNSAQKISLVTAMPNPYTALIDDNYIIADGGYLISNGKVRVLCGVGAYIETSFMTLYDNNGDFLASADGITSVSDNYTYDAEEGRIYINGNGEIVPIWVTT